MKSRIFNIIQIIAAAALAAGVMTAFTACELKEDGTWMHCHGAQQLVFGLGIAITAVSVIMLFLKKKGIRILLGLANIVLAVVTLAVPGGIVSMCMMADMRCHMVMKPFVILMSIVIIVLTVCSLIFALKKSRTNEKKK